MPTRERITPQDLMTLTGYGRTKAQQLMKTIEAEAGIKPGLFATVDDVAQVLRIREEKIRAAMRN